MKSTSRYYLFLFVWAIVFSKTGLCQTWVTTYYYDYNNGLSGGNHYSLYIGPYEMCVTPNHTTFALVRTDQEGTTQLFKGDSAGVIQINSVIITPSGLHYESCDHLHSTPDNGCVYIYRYSGTGNTDSKAVKINRFGQIAWTKDYQNSNLTINDFVPTSFNTYYLILGDSLVELNNNGNFIRSRVPVLGTINTMDDSDFIAFTGTNINREDFNGNIQWSIPDSGFQSLHTDTSFIYALKSALLLKIHTLDGSLAWSKYIPHTVSYSNYIGGIFITSDGGIITTNPPDLISRYDSSGNLLWSRSIPFPEMGLKGIVENNPGTYITGGAFRCKILRYLSLYYGFSYFFMKLDSTAHGVIDSTDHYFIGNANDNNTFSFGDDAAYVSAAIGSSGLARLPIFKDLPSRSVFGTNWSTGFPVGINYKYSDVDGNGIIDTVDVRKLSELYPFQTFAPSHWRLSSQSSQLPDLKLLFEEDSVVAGDTATIDIIVGDSILQVDSIYALSITLYHNYLFNQTDGHAYIPVSDFGNPSVNLYSFFSNQSATGFYSMFAISRKDHQNALLNGDTIARLRIATSSVLPSGYKTLDAIYNAITVGGFPVSLNLIKDSINVLNTTSIKILQDHQIEISPNPVSEKVRFLSPFENIDQMIITENNGRVMLDVKDIEKIFYINVAQYPAGIYNVTCFTKQGVHKTRFVVAH